MSISPIHHWGNTKFFIQSQIMNPFYSFLTDPILQFNPSTSIQQRVPHLVWQTTFGNIPFVIAPDFENPLDADSDNVYLFTFTASDRTYSDSRTYSVTVTDVSE